MTYNPAVPNAAQSPGLFPAQNNTNYTRIKSIVNADHVFNDTAPSPPNNNDGFHRQMTMVSRASPVSLPGGSNAILYTKIDSLGQSQLRFYNGTRDVAITPPYIVAMVNFDGRGSIGSNQMMRSQLNVATVKKDNTGQYTINFTTPLVNANYIVELTGMRSTSLAADVCNGSLLSSTTYNSSVTTTFVKIQFNGSNSTLQDVIMGNVLITSVG